MITVKIPFCLHGYLHSPDEINSFLRSTTIDQMKNNFYHDLKKYRNNPP